MSTPELPEEIQAASVAGLQALQEAGLIKHRVDHKSSHVTGLLIPANQENNDPRDCWSTVAKFQDGHVVSLDLGSCRLRKGIPIDLSEYFGTHLKTLNLGGTDLPLKDTLEVLQSLSETLECLYLGGNYLGNAGAEQIANWLPSASRLRKIDLRYTEVGPAGCRALCDGMSRQGKVTHVYFEGNNLGDEGAQLLAELLKQGGCPVQELFLGANKIGASGAAALASTLATNKTISKLYLEGNQIGPIGAEAFAKSLKQCDGNTALKHLFVDNNNVGKEVSQRLAAALNSATAIGDSFLEE